MDNLSAGLYDRLMLVDAHAHLSFLNNDQVALVIDTPAPWVDQWILGGYDPADWQRQIELKDRWPDRIQTCLGLHPWVAANLSSKSVDSALIELEGLIYRADWVGEVGLDVSSKALQQKRDVQMGVFQQQLQIAQVYKKSCVFHMVGGVADFLKCWDAYPVSGFVHGFSGAPEIARELTSRGLFISVGPGLLKGHFKKLQKTVEALDLEFLLLESDSPESPKDARGYEGHQLLLQLIDQVCSLKSISREALKNQLVKNLENSNRIGMKKKETSRV